MALQKYGLSVDSTSPSLKSLSFSTKANGKAQFEQRSHTAADADIDLREVYFLIMHFLSTGPCQRTYGQFWNELLQHNLLPRRYHAWYSRSGTHSGDENDDGMSLPLSYNKLAERYPHIEKDHLVKLLKQLMLSAAAPPRDVVGGNAMNAAAAPTLLGTGSFSLLSCDKNKKSNQVNIPPGYMRWPHMKADEVRGLSLREIGGGFSRHHRAPSVRAACYVIAKPSTMLQKMQNIKKVRGHRNAVYCAIFDRLGRYVITGSDDRLVKIWSMETAYCLVSCRGHDGDITDLAVNFNNTLVASASNDFIIRVWRIPDGLPISVLRGHTGAVTAIAFSPRAFYQLLSLWKYEFCCEELKVDSTLGKSIPKAYLVLFSKDSVRGDGGFQDLEEMEDVSRCWALYPRMSCESGCWSSDDGTCRMWDARSSQFSPRIYVPKPPDLVTGKSSDPMPSNGQLSHQIFCCAFNANGTVFVTGSSDTRARVWNACKSSTDESEQGNHEMDLLAGHENDVNYVQFSGCAVVSKLSLCDVPTEDNVPKFKNSWFTHENIVTCSRDGSAIIWIPRTRRSHGRGRWIRAYHLKVPPPPMPPQPLRGGPRQRILPTPRGVNMIVWSLDNRFVLAAIMDCRICVWNAVDGSLVHSLTGHTESTYVLDVHPFNPRIAMSAGYDGKTIVWDIWEGVPIRIYEIGRFKLVDGKFSPDGTSIILSDDVGQLYILNTGQGESQSDAKYDQFFLGDYRPLVTDTHGNVLDQETQLAPYRRNLQDLLCDAGMIPYPEPYQSTYQQRRLGALGFEWRPSSVRYAVGTDISLDQDYQMPPIADLDILIDPLPEFLDAMDWEPEIEIRTEDTDSEYNITEEYSSGGEQGSLSASSSGDPESSAEDTEVKDTHKDSLRRSKRKTRKAEVEIMTSSGRRVKRKNLDEFDGSTSSKSRFRKSRNGREASKKKSSVSTTLRPQRAAARNALNFFSRITGTSLGTSTDREEEIVSEGESSESESTMQDSNIESENSDISLQEEPIKHSKGKEVSLYESEDVGRPHDSDLSSGNKRRLVLRLPNRDSIKRRPLEISIPEFRREPDTVDSSSLAPQGADAANRIENHLDLLEGYEEGRIKWGGVRTRTSKRSRVEEPFPSGAYTGASLCFHAGDKTENLVNGHPKSEEERGRIPIDSDILSQGPKADGGECMHLEKSPKKLHLEDEDGPESAPILKENPTPMPTKLRIRSLLRGQEKSKVRINSPVEDSMNDPRDTLSESPLHNEHKPSSEVPDYNAAKMPISDNGASEESTRLQDLQRHPHDRMFSAVYRRSKSIRLRGNDGGGVGASTSNAADRNLDEPTETAAEGIRRTRSMGWGPTTRDSNLLASPKFAACDGSEETSTSAENNGFDDEIPSEEWRSNSRVGLRSTRSRRVNYYSRETSPSDRRKSQQSGRSSWLMMSSHEEGPRYIPQKGDEVVYGHEEYITRGESIEAGPWKTVRGNIGAVELCRVVDLDYSWYPGSGESCCKMRLQFVGPTSSVAGKSFTLTLPEVTEFPDFLVERSRYDAAIERKWTVRDKCQVWWKDQGAGGGGWWAGRILSVKPKSPEFPDSPWDSYEVRYKNDPSESLFHSPWELYDDDIHWEQPRIDEGLRKMLLKAFAKLEQSGNKVQDQYGVQKLKQVSRRSNFINRFPVPLSLEVIHSRLENNYYRNLEAVKNDIMATLKNAETYFGKNAELLKKMKRLSDWFTRTLSSL
ncbi:hypothetical protein RJ640_014707 [Escallonia rubra]|uniref:Bromo domain-containing protein n=1 Tax=Escallonia rubra TaxID=112253 RepID=A0AA88UM12_9ASTE|nr:hypothetical protein RJ640_014707 [Escallonia rubra]